MIVYGRSWRLPARFGLRTLFVATALCAVGLAGWRHATRTERAIAQFEALGGTVSNTTFYHCGFERQIDEQHGLELPYYWAVIDDQWRGGDAGLVHLAAIPQLQQLSIRAGAQLGESALAFVSRLTDLRLLSLEEIEVDADAVLQLNALSELRCLTLCAVKVRTGDPWRLVSRSLTMLDLTGTTIDDDALRELHRLPSLRELCLRGTRITDSGLSYLSSRLTELALIDASITDGGLANLKHVKDLEWLSIVGTRVTDRGLASLADLPRLAFVDAGNTAVTRAGEDVLNAGRTSENAITLKLEVSEPPSALPVTLAEQPTPSAH